MKHPAIFLGFVILYLFFAYPSVSSTPYRYDEADYVYAAERGFVANSLDRPSLSFPEYVRLGMSRGTDARQNASMSVAVRRAGDLFVYRHAHGPIYFYWLSLVSTLGTAEHFIRAAGLIFPILTAAAIYVGCLWILPGAQGLAAAILGCAMYLLNPAVIRTTELTPHQMYAVWFTITLLLLAKLMMEGSRRWWYWAVVATGLAFCTLEVTFVLIAVVLICGYLERKRLGFDWRLTGTSTALFAATVVVLHPAEITRLAFAKSYLFFAYLAFKRTAPWGDVGFAGTWAARFAASPVIWLLIAIALFGWVRFRDLPGRRQALPFLLFGAFMVASMVRVFASGLRYVLPFLPALAVFAAIVVSGVLTRLRPGLRAGVLAVTCVVLWGDLYRYSAMHPIRFDTRSALMIAGIRQQNLTAGRLLVPHDDLPTIHYYFPEADTTPYSDESELPAGRFDAIVRMDESARIDRMSPGEFRQ